MQVTSCLYCGSSDLNFVTERADRIEILECGNCELMMTKNLPGHTEDLYTTEYFEKNADNNHGYSSYLSSPIADMVGKFAFTHLFTGHPGKHLDLGCADGSLIEIFQANGYESRGLEISAGAVEVAREKGLDVKRSDLNTLPHKHDVITAFDLIEHLQAPKRVMSQIHSALNKNGLFVFSTLDVTQKDTSEYWFNNSLEHYIYFNKSNLTNILENFFGPNNHIILEVDMAGIHELWGIAKKGPLSVEEKNMASLINKRGYTVDGDKAYLLSLFFNQVFDFRASQAINTKFRVKWPSTTKRLADFYFEYHQGRFENAVQTANRYRSIIPAHEGIFWQAHSFASNEIMRINEEKLKKEFENEVSILQQQLFDSRSELVAMKNSRVLGRVIKLRNYTGDARHHLSLVVKKTREIVAPRIPGPARRLIKSLVRRVLRTLKPIHDNRPLGVKYVVNKKWPANTHLVSVIIPYFNRANTIEDTIRSLEGQTFRNFEVIIVDDGSTEQLSQDKLKDIKNSILKPRIIHQENQGVAAARNNGITRARGKYIICLDSDDILEPTYVEKATVLLETNPDIALVTTHQQIFGVTTEDHKNNPYNPRKLPKDNMVITAAEFRKEAWQAAGGYKSGIGYEDWEFWLNLSERGFWGKLIPEALFKYRTAIKSRFIEDREVHWDNIKVLSSLHPEYNKNVTKLQKIRRFKHLVKPESSFINLSNRADYPLAQDKRPKVLITVPWLTFGGAETLIYNYCREIKNSFSISYITGLQVEHNWEYKFREISENIYHLPNLMDEELYLEFISNYIDTRGIDILHIIHNGFTFGMLAELKKRHSSLRVVLTLFNDRVEYFDQSIKVNKYIDLFTTDNSKVHAHYLAEVENSKVADIIPNGIDCDSEYNPAIFDRAMQREAMGIQKNQKAVFFIGRLSEEKNPDVFLRAAEKILATRDDVKFFVIGDGFMRPKIEKQISDINSSNVEYLGYQADVAKYLSAADIFVLPSSIEGFPLSILEAMAMKVVVVASDVGAISEVLEKGQTGKLITPGSADEAAEAILELVADDKKLNSMKESGRKVVEKEFSTRRLGDNYTDLYRKALKL